MAKKQQNYRKQSLSSNGTCHLIGNNVIFSHPYVMHIALRWNDWDSVP